MELAFSNNNFTSLDYNELLLIEGGSISGFFIGVAAVACGVAAIAAAIVVAPVAPVIAVGAFFIGSAASAVGGAVVITNAAGTYD